MARPIERIRIQAFLSQMPLFEAISEAELDRIALGTSTVRLDRGEQLFRRGDPCLGIHMVIYGQIKLAFVSPNGAEKVVQLVSAGHSFGEAVMFMDKPYIVAAQATDDSLLLHVSRQAVMDEIVRDPSLACKMLAGLSRRMHGLMCDLESYCLSSGTQRVIAYLCQQGPQEDGAVFRLPVSKGLVASRLNLTPEHFSRILTDLGAHGLIAVKGRSITVLALEKLRHYGD
jgi:CRP-like cAMP-binding protein